jgi:orotidine-5'-phosphate decarboxylase
LLCVGLDPEPERFPAPWRGDPARIFDFCARIVDATKDLVCAYKPQIAYFAAHRAEDQLDVDELYAGGGAHVRSPSTQARWYRVHRGQHAKEAFERYAPTP